MVDRMSEIKAPAGGGDGLGAGRLQEKSAAELLAEWQFWHARIMAANQAADSLAAFGARRRAGMELRRRGLEVPRS